MSSATITLEVPETLYERLMSTAVAMQRPLQEVVLRALTVGCPPRWEDVPEEFQSALSALDRLEDEALWRLARGHRSGEEFRRYEELLDQKQERDLSAVEQRELAQLRYEADLFVLRKAQAAALLRWRGHVVQAV